MIISPKFQAIVDNLENQLQSLLKRAPVIAEEIPNNTPVGGVYLFSEGITHLYVGRTKRRITQRINNHFSTAPDCPFAWHLAREATGIAASYTQEGSRKKLLADGAFNAAYQSAKNRIRRMDVRYVHEPEPVNQALLEIYVAFATEAGYNNFDTH